MNKKIKKSIIVGELFLSLLMLLWYKYGLSPEFSYAGFVSNHFSYYKLALFGVAVITNIGIGYKIKNEVYYFVYNIFFLRYVLPGYIMYVFTEIDLIPTLLMEIPLILFLVVDNIKLNFNVKNKKISLQMNAKTYFIFIAILFICILPFVQNIGTINLNNLFFTDVYDTRLAVREISNPLIGYLSSPLARYLLPFMAVIAIINKKFGLFIFVALGEIFIFLTAGALKTILISFLFALFFYKGSYEQKIKRFINVLNLTLILEFFSILVLKTSFFTTYFRRIFFIPIYSFNEYYTFFKSNYTLYSHTAFAELLGIESEYRGITLWFGKNVLGTEAANANVGSFVEAYFSLGVLGFFVISIIFISFFVLYKNLKVDFRFAGLLFVFIDLFNSSLFETFFITHGGILYIFLLYKLIPSYTQNKNTLVSISDNY